MQTPLTIPATSNGLFLCPSTIEAESQSLLLYSEKISRIYNGDTLAVESDFQRFSSISVLLVFSAPIAILWRIIAVIVFPFNRMARSRLEAHVGKEVTEGAAPSFANLNAAPAIPNESRIFRVVAALGHSAPRVVFGRINHSVLMHRIAARAPITLGFRERLSYHLRRFSMCVHIGFSGLSEVLTLPSCALTFTI
jgi:hypothetical protein